MEAVVMLQGANRQQFIRSVRDKDGKVVKILKFLRNEPVTVGDEELLAIEADLGVALFACAEMKSGRFKADADCTKALLKDIRKLKKRPRRKATQALKDIEKDEPERTDEKPA